MRSTAGHLAERDKRALTAGRYGTAIAIMREMHWSWQELRAAPADLVQEIVIRLSAENDAQEMKTQKDGGGKGKRQ